MKKVLFLGPVLACVLLNGCMKETIMTQPGQHAQSFEKELTKKAELRYWLYLPREYGNVEKQWPLMMFLHGGGEKGTDLNRVLVHGPAKLASEGKDFPFIIISPQCPPDSRWNEITEELAALFDSIIENYDVDNTRLYVTGLSMGGAGTWAMIQRYPNKFAAAAPICGGGDRSLARRRLKELPIWVFHGAKDNTVPLERSQEMVDAIKKAGNANIEFTIYSDAGHDSWTETYNNPELYEWFLKHTVRQ